MTLANTARRELGKVYITAQVGFGLFFWTVAERTGRSYGTVASLYAERASEAAAVWVLSLPTWLAWGVVTVPMLALLYVRLREVTATIEAMVHRHGLLRSILAGGAFAIALAVVVEHRPELLWRTTGRGL